MDFVSALKGGGPAAAKRRRTLGRDVLVVGQMALAMVFLAGGLVLSVEWNLPLSQSAGGVGFIGLVVSFLIARLFQ